MVEILQFKGKGMTSIKTKSLVKEILKQILSEADSIRDVIIFTKYNDDSFVLHHSGPSLADKSFTIQLLQHDISKDITELQEDSVEFTPES